MNDQSTTDNPDEAPRLRTCTNPRCPLEHVYIDDDPMFRVHVEDARRSGLEVSAR